MNDSDFDDLLKKTSALPREIAPGRDLWPELKEQLGRPREKRRLAPVLQHWLPRLGVAAAVVALVSAGVFWFRHAEEPGWTVAAVSGTPFVDAQRLIGEGKWRLGQWLETDATSHARFVVGSIGEVRLDPNSRLRLLGTDAHDHRLQLVRGTLHALIWAPPRLFFVETPSATAIDLGCAYTLTVDDAGASLLHVTSGYVALERGDRTLLVPAGQICVTRPDAGLGTPYSENTTPEFRDALGRFDFSEEDASALSDVLARASAGDEITLWYVLGQVDASWRAAVFDKLSSLNRPPAGISRGGILSGDQAMLTRWADHLGLPSALFRE